MIERHHDWRERLGRAIEQANTRSFEWGTFDCALHVCDCVKEITGIDLAEKHRGTYSDAAGAELIHGDSFQEFVAKLAAEFELPEVPPTMARRGDIVYVDNGTPQGSLGIVSLDGRFAACASDQGVVLARMHRWKRAWRVGR